MNNIKTFENFNNQDIFTYIKDDDIESIKNYIESGYDLNIQNINGYTPLSYATIYGRIESVKLLLNAGADINIQDSNISLLYAVIINRIEIVKLLLNTGIYIDKQDKYGNTALIYAASNNNCEMLELLLDYGADEFILNDENKSFYYYLNNKNKQYFTQKYPTSVYNAISHNYKKSFTEFIKDYNIK